MWLALLAEVAAADHAPRTSTLVDDRLQLSQPTSSWRESIQPAIQRTRKRTASVPIAATW